MPTLTHARRPVLVALTLLATVLAVHVAPAAAAEKSCAVAVIDDWYGNSRVDKRYPLHCYRDAIATLTPDQKDYMHAEEDILRALAYAKKGKNDPGVARSSSARGGDSETTTPTTTESVAQPPAKPGSPTTVAIDDVPDEGQTGIPLPLLLLGGLALMLLVAGGAGAVSRRLGRGSGTDES